MQIIQGKEAAELRELYAEAFLDTHGERYRRYTAMPSMGLMWDCFPVSQGKKSVESERTCLWQIERRTEVYVIWDVYAYGWGMWHPLPEFVPEHYATSSVMRMSAEEFLAHYKEFPDDIYVFDDSLTWTVILTHEYYGAHDKRICYYMEEENS